jgi:phosphate transport system protein
MGGIRGQFDRELENIETKVIALLGMVVEDLAVATQALLGSPTGAPAALAEREQLIDSLYVETENLAVRQIVMHAPVASDLRLLLTVLRVVPELERSHDLVVHIASRAPLSTTATFSHGRSR